MTVPTPDELTAVARHLTMMANADQATADPNDPTAFYARCIVHAAALNLLAAADGKPRDTGVNRFTGTLLAAGGDVTPDVYDSAEAVQSAASGEQR